MLCLIHLGELDLDRPVSHMDPGLKFSRITSNVRILIRRTKHELIIKLIAHE